MSHRRPPFPDTYNGSRTAPRGKCRWCAEPIFKIKDGEEAVDRRRLWHTPCVIVHGIAASPRYARAQVEKRDHGKCAECGAVTPFWELDHIRPLHLVDRKARYALDYWLLGNMQTLCKPCHKAKSAKEQSAQAKVKRIQESDGLTKRRPNAKRRWLERRAPF